MDSWPETLLLLLDILCALMGCAADQPAASDADVSAAIQRLATTVIGSGVAPLSGSDRAIALDAAIDAAIIADANQASLGAENYQTLTRTLDSVIGALASGPDR